MVPGALDGLRVLSFGHGIAGPYCTKLLADLGADVIKVERPGGEPARRHGPFLDDRPDPDASGLFLYLNANKRSVVLDLEFPRDAARARALAVGADLVVENFRPGTLERFGLDLDALRAANPTLALVRISAFGQTGPSRDLPVTDLVLQAAGGWVGNYTAPGGGLVRVGGSMPEFLAGAFAACSALTAVHAARRRGEAVEVDLSMLECLVGTLAYPMLAHAVMPSRPRAPARAARPGPPRAPFGILRCKDGFVGINILTSAHWANACRAIGAPEYAESRAEVSQDPAEYEAFAAKLRPWLEHNTAEEILEQCQALRIPTAVVCDGRSLLESSQFRARPFFIQEPCGRFLQPGFPYRLGLAPPSLRAAAPTLAEAAGEPDWREPRRPPLGLERASEGDLPFRGLRVLDLGTFWAGPYMGMYLASLGADVVKVESVQRPDGFRFIGTFDPDSPDFYETGTLFQATNLGKRDVTLDLSRDRGRSLLLRLASSADVLIENFAPRVMERFGLDYPQVRAVRSDIVMVRMPAFGLEGPWRDYTGWAMAISQAAGISWLTGDPSDELPRNPGAFIDPAVAMHALVAIQAALAQRRLTGEGQMIEMAQLETAACMCPEPIIDFSLNGRTQGARGNRSPGCAPEGIYACADGHVALSVRDDADWSRLVAILGSPAWAAAPGLMRAAVRVQRADVLDARLGEWLGARQAADAARLLRDGGVPAAQLLLPANMYDEPQLDARGYYQTLIHPVSGERRYPGWPMQFSFTPRDLHPSCTPTLGQHNDQVLGGELGLSAAELERLRKHGIIGERLKT